MRQACVAERDSFDYWLRNWRQLIQLANKLLEKIHLVLHLKSLTSFAKYIVVWKFKTCSKLWEVQIKGIVKNVLRTWKERAPSFFIGSNDRYV